MTRLFIRFYLGILFILVIAWLLQTWLYGKRMEPVYTNIIRDVYFGGIRVARQKYIFGQELRRRGDSKAEERLFNEIKGQYDFPVRLHAEDPDWDFGAPQPGDEASQRWDRIHLCRGTDHGLGEGLFIMARVRKGESPVLLFGPLPELVGPPVSEVLLGVGAVLALSAVAIALLLRPVMKQFQTVEAAAQTIASGDLSTRIEPKRGFASSKLVQAFNNMAGRTESMVQSQNELLQAVSHELRTPLSRIHFATDLIRTANKDQREEKLLALESAADDLDKIVGELMTYVRAEDAPKDAPAPFKVNDVIHAVFEKHSPLFPDISFEASENLANTTITADVPGFERVMTNLLANAARFGKNTVRVSAETKDSEVIIHVDDDGPGIPAADRERAFEPFVQLGDSGPGVGLGLAIVRRIVENNGGAISIETSPLGGGCRMRTIWPA